MKIWEPLWDRFQSGFVKAENGCWVWQKAKSGDGYGRIRPPGGRSVVAHRVAYELLIGPIPAGMTLDHLCRNRGCVNPAHLEPVTFRENCIRGISFSAENAKKGACINGHELTGDNLYIRPNGNRQCRRCNADAAAAYKARKGAA